MALMCGQALYYVYTTFIPLMYYPYTLYTYAVARYLATYIIVNCHYS